MQIFTSFFTFLLSAEAIPVLAYIGPGSGLTAIGTLIAFIVAILLAIIGFVWYPAKRLLAKKREKKQKASDT